MSAFDPPRLVASGWSRRFVHWGSYENARLTAYVERYEDPDGTAASILGSLFDLHQALVTDSEVSM